MPGHRKPRGARMSGRPKGHKLVSFNMSVEEIDELELAVQISGMTKTNLMKRATLEAARKIIADAKARGSLPQLMTHAA